MVATFPASSGDKGQRQMCEFCVLLYATEARSVAHGEVRVPLGPAGGYGVASPRAQRLNGVVSPIYRNSHKFRQLHPMPWMRAALASSQVLYSINKLTYIEP